MNNRKIYFFAGHIHLLFFNLCIISINLPSLQLFPVPAPFVNGYFPSFHTTTSCV